MDPNIPRDDSAGGQAPPGPGGTDASAWNQVPSQPAAGSGQETTAESVPWPNETPSQPAAPPPAETGSYAAGGYAEQPPATEQYQQPQQYGQQPGSYDQGAYAQQQYQQPGTYDQGAYAQQQYGQQPGSYDQGTYAQPQQYGQQPGYYDQSAYGQQQYQQPQQYGQQPGYYDQSAYGQQQYQQPQYYDPNLYNQQPGYYDQSAYGQQQYQQPQAQYGQPYGYAPAATEPYWDQQAGGYGRSFMAVLAGWLLIAWGAVFLVIGALVLWVQSVTDLIPSSVTLSQDVLDLASKADDQIVAVGGIAMIVGIIQLIAGIGVLGHRNWGRAFAIVVGLLGVLAGLGIVTVSFGFEALDVGIQEAVKGEEGSVAMSLLVLITYLFVFLAMFVGRRHFRRRGVDS